MYEREIAMMREGKKDVQKKEASLAIMNVEIVRQIIEQTNVTNINASIH